MSSAPKNILIEGAPFLLDAIQCPELLRAGKAQTPNFAVLGHWIKKQELSEKAWLNHNLSADQLNFAFVSIADSFSVLSILRIKSKRCSSFSKSRSFGGNTFNLSCPLS